MADEQTQAAQQAAPSPHPDFTKPPAQPGEQRAAPAQAAPAPPPAISLPVDEYQRFRGLERQLNDFQAQQQKALDDARNAEIKALADKGEVEKALAEQRKDWEAKHAEALNKFKSLESHICDKEAESVLSNALSGQVFAGQDEAARASAAKMLKTILRGEVEAVRDPATGTIVVRDKASGRPAADVLRERLSDPTLAFFFAPNSRGGSGGDGTRTPANKDAPKPGSLEAIAAQFKAAQGPYGSVGLRPVG